MQKIKTHRLSLLHFKLLSKTKSLCQVCDFEKLRHAVCLVQQRLKASRRSHIVVTTFTKRISKTSGPEKENQIQFKINFTSECNFSICHITQNTIEIFYNKISNITQIFSGMRQESKRKVYILDIYTNSQNVDINVQVTQLNNITSIREDTQVTRYRT